MGSLALLWRCTQLWHDDKSHVLKTKTHESHAFKTSHNAQSLGKEDALKTLETVSHAFADKSHVLKTSHMASHML
jgi:hypothetical protein